MSRQPWFASADAMLPRVRIHQPTMLPGNVLVDYLPAEGLYRSWEGAPDRSGHDLTFPCASGSSGPLDATDDAVGHQLVAVDRAVLDYHEASGRYRVLHCPPEQLRQGFPNPSCRKLGYGVWPSGRVVTYLGGGRVMAWHRRSMSFSVWDSADRGAQPLQNDSQAAFFTPGGEGTLLGVHNESQLMHLRLAQGSTTSGAPASAEVVLELAPGRGTYRVWNSEGWARGVWRPPAVEGGKMRPGGRSPLRGPVARGAFPSSAPGMRWTTASDSSSLLEMDAVQGSYRVVALSVTDLEQLQPATTSQPPLAFAVLHEGKLDEDAFGAHCAAAASRAGCAALGGHCGWCEQPVMGLNAPACLRGGPAGPCDHRCAAWHFDDTVPPPSPPAPSPPPLLEAGRLRVLLEATHRAALASRTIVEGATTEGWRVAGTRRAVADFDGSALGAPMPAAGGADEAAVAAAAEGGGAPAAPTSPASPTSPAAATLALVGAQHGGSPASNGDARQPCKQVRAGDAPPRQGEETAGGAVSAGRPSGAEECADGADCLKLAKLPAAPQSVLVHHDAGRRPGQPPSRQTMADLPSGRQALNWGRDQRPLDSLLTISRRSSALQPQHSAMTLPDDS